MNKKTVLWLCILFTITSPKSYSQNQQKIDSLLNEINKAKEDTNRIRLLNTLCWEWITRGEFEKALQNIAEAKSLSESLILKTKDVNQIAVLKSGLAKAYDYTGIIYAKQGNYDEALKNHYSAIKIGKQAGDKKGNAISYFNIGIVHHLQGDFSASLEAFSVFLKICLEEKDSAGIARAYNNIGNAYHSQGDFPKAMKSYYASLKIREKINDKRGLTSCYLNIGNIAFDQEDYKEALKNYLTSLKLNQELENKEGIALAYHNISSVHIKLGNYKEGIKNCLEALTMRKKLGDKKGIASSYIRLGTIYLEQGNYNESLENLFSSLKVSKEIGEKDGTASCLHAIGNAYFKKGEFTKAIENLNASLTLAKEINYEDIVKENYKLLSEVYEEKKDFKNGLLYHHLFTDTKDSLFNQEKNKQITEIKSKYESEKKEKEIVVLTKDKEIQNVEIKKQKLLKYSLMSGLGLVLILVFLGYRMYSTRQLLKLQTLRNKIASDLHDDVGSTLSSISIFSEMAKEQSSEVTPMLEQIGDSSRKMLDAMADIVWTINPENDQFEKIILRMKSFAYELLGAKKIDFEFEADENVSALKLPMDVRKNLYLIFKEATNNMVKYSEANKASFSISGNKEMLTMFIRDNGKGFDVNKDSQGNGLKNMKKRAKEIGASLLIESEAGTGTTLQLILNIA